MGNRRFPLFVDLTGRKAVVIGGGPVGLRRARVLGRFGADVTLISPKLSGEAGDARWVRRAYRPGDLEGAYLVIAAAGDPEVNAAAGREARAAGAFFNRADLPSECDFYFPAVCEGGGVVAGVVGGGEDHRRVAQAAREIRTVLGRENDEAPRREP